MNEVRLKLIEVLLIACVLCSPTWADWYTPVPVDEINTSGYESGTSLSHDGLSFYFSREPISSPDSTRIYVATRPQPFGPFTSVEQVTGLGGGSDDIYAPCISFDNLRLYYSEQVGSSYLIKLSERNSVYDPWSAGINISEISSLGHVQNINVSADELTIFFDGYNLPGGQGGWDIWQATRADIDSAFGNVTNLAAINSSSYELHASATSDGLTIYFRSDRNGTPQIFKATRPSVDQAFGTPEHMPVFDTPDGSSAPFISSDGFALYFSKISASSGTADIYVSYLVKMEVAVDIKPGNSPNPLNPGSRGVLPVAVLGTEDFDVSQIDIATVRLAGVAAVRSSFEDVAGPVVDGNVCDCTDSDGDGYMDLTLKFNTVEVVEQLIGIINDLAKGDQVALTLTGAMIDQTPIEGEDCVIIVSNVPQSLRARKADINEDGIVNMGDFGVMTSNWLVHTPRN